MTFSSFEKNDCDCVKKLYPLEDYVVVVLCNVAQVAYGQSTSQHLTRCSRLSGWNCVSMANCAGQGCGRLNRCTDHVK